MSASPHQLICMLFDGAQSTIGMARHHMATGDIGPKGQAISKAVDIVDNGLRAVLDAKAAGPEGEALVANLSALYGYIIQRLLQPTCATTRRRSTKPMRCWKALRRHGAIDAGPARD